MKRLISIFTLLTFPIFLISCADNKPQSESPAIDTPIAKPKSPASKLTPEMEKFNTMVGDCDNFRKNRKQYVDCFRNAYKVTGNPYKQSKQDIEYELRGIYLRWECDQISSSTVEGHKIFEECFKNVNKTLDKEFPE